MSATAMTHKTFRRNLNLVRKWGYQCVICGRPFAHMACVTIEHVVPVSAGVISRKNKMNQAPSHWRCNQLKGSLPLIVAAKTVDAMDRKLGPKNFHDWLNARVPNRESPWYAFVPLVDAEWFAL